MLGHLRVAFCNNCLKLRFELSQARGRLGRADLGLLELGLELGDSFQRFRDGGLNLSGASLLRCEQRALELRGALLEGGALLRNILELAFEHRDTSCGAGRGFGPLRITCL